MKSVIASNEPDWLKISEICASIHTFLRVYDVPGITAAQLTDVKRQNKELTDGQMIGTSRFGRSSQILHHVNVAIMILSRNNEELREDMSLHIVKNRSGGKGSGSIIKKLANARLIDVPMDKNKSEDDSDLQTLISRVKERREREQEESKRKLQDKNAH